MKKVVVFIGVLLLILGLAYFSNSKRVSRKESRVKIVFKNEKVNFLKEEDIKRVVETKNDLLQKIELNSLENRVKENPIIKNAEVYRDIEKGDIIIEVEERKPMLRIVGKENFYIDSLGVKFPLSKYHTSYVPLFYGELKENEIEKVVDFVKQIKKDSLLKNEIIQIKKNNQGYSTRFRSYNFDIEWGDFRRYREKRDNLVKLLRYLKKEPLKFKKVSLKYKNQIITSK